MYMYATYKKCVRMRANWLMQYSRAKKTCTDLSAYGCVAQTPRNAVHGKEPARTFQLFMFIHLFFFGARGRFSSSAGSKPQTTRITCALFLSTSLTNPCQTPYDTSFHRLTMSSLAMVRRCSCATDWAFRTSRCVHNLAKHNTLQWDTVQYNTGQYDAIHYGTITYNTIRYYTAPYYTYTIYIYIYYTYTRYWVAQLNHRVIYIVCACSS